MSDNLISSVTGFIKKYHLNVFKDVALFMTILLFFHFLYRFFVSDFMSIGLINNSAALLAHNVYLSSKWIMELFNIGFSSYDELIIDGMSRRNVFYWAENNGYVSVNNGCSGLKQFYQWTILMVLYPGPWKHKLWFIPFGLLIIHVVNIFRIVSISIVTIQIPQHWDFMHDYILRPFFYVVMFGLWVWWNEKFKNKHKEKNKKTSYS